MTFEGGGFFVGVTEGGRVSIIPFRKGGDVEKGVTVRLGMPFYGTGIMVNEFISALAAARDEAVMEEVP